MPASYLGGGSAANDATGGGINSIAVTFSPNVTAGSLLVLGVTFDSGASDAVDISTIADNRGNTWTIVPSTNIVAATHQRFAMAYAMNAAAGSTTVTVTTTTTTVWYRMVAAEYSGIVTTGALDKSAAQNANNTTATDNATSGATATLTQADELVVSAIMDNNSDAVFSAGTGFTRRQITTTANDIAIEDKTVAATTAVSGTWTGSASSNYLAGVATFKISSGATGATVNAVPASAGSTWAVSPLVTAGVVLTAAVSLVGGVRAPAPTVTAGSAATVAAAPARLGAVRGVAPAVFAGTGATTNAAPASAGGVVAVAPQVSAETQAAGGGAATLGAVRGVAPTVTGGAAGGATVNAFPVTIGSVTGAAPALAVGSTIGGAVATLGTVRGNTAAAGATVTIVAAVATLGPVCSPTSVPTAAATLPATPARFSAVRVVAPTVVGGSANDGTPVANPRAHLTVARSRAILTTHSSRGTVT